MGVGRIVVPLALGASLPILTFVWLLVAALVLRRAATPSALGLVRVPGREFAQMTVAATVAMTLLFGAAEMATHPYRELLHLVRAESTPDSTFAFAAVQALPAALLPVGAAVGFLVIDAVLAVGLVGGLAAHRTQSIYPGLIAITVANVVVVAAVA